MEADVRSDDLTVFLKGDDSLQHVEEQDAQRPHSGRDGIIGGRATQDYAPFCLKELVEEVEEEEEEEEEKAKEKLEVEEKEKK